MDRLIYKEANGDLTCRSRDFEKIFPTLYAYEETGYTPEGIAKIEGVTVALRAENAAIRSELAKVKAELVDERHRHDRYVDFELDEAAELSRYKQAEKEGRLVILDEPMVPVAEDSDPLSSDVFCPRCGENLSGAYADEERILLQCFKCGQYIDGTKAMTYAEAEEWRKKEG